MTLPPDPAPRNLPGDPLEEWQSAWFDRELSTEHGVAQGNPGLREPDPVRLHEYQRLSQLLQSLPVERLPADFASRLIADLADPKLAPLPHTELPKPGRPPGFFPRRLAWLVASLAGVAVLVARWQPAVAPSRTPADSSPFAELAPSAKLTAAASSPGLATRESLVARLNDIPSEELAIIRIRVPQRGANSPTESEAMDLTERAFGEHLITQVTDGRQLAEGPPASLSPPPATAGAPGAGLRTTASPADPMLLLVVGESEAIVQSLEQLLQNLEQTQLEEEIEAVAQTELNQLSAELNRSLGESLANLEESWSPAGTSGIERTHQLEPQAATKNVAANTLRRGTPEGQPRSRGSMAWLPPDSLANSSGATAPATASPATTAGRPRQKGSALGAAPAAEAKRAPALADQPARAARGLRESPTAKAQSSETAPSSHTHQPGEPPPPLADTAPVPSPESDRDEGRRPRRVLIQLICEPAG